MTFGEPKVLIWGALALPLLLVFLFIASRSRKAALKRFADKGLLDQLSRTVSPGRRRLKGFLLVLSLALVILSLARPQWGYRWVEMKATGVDVVIAIDVSRSMLAQDVSPDRLTRAKFVAYDLISGVRGNRIGLVAFAGRAFLQCPLTLDLDAVQQTLETFAPEIIPIGGSDLGLALRESAAAFDNEESSRFIVMISDGEDLVGNGAEVARELNEQGIRIFTIGVGTLEGELIPLEENGTMTFQRDDSGNIVRTRLEPETLRSIAAAANGQYLELRGPHQSLAGIRREINAAQTNELSTERLKRVPMERYGWFLFPAILLLAFEFLISTRRKERVVACLAVGLLLSGVFTPATSFATENENSRLTPEAHYNAGVDAYRQGDLERAENSFYRALNSERRRTQAASHFNIGNTLVRASQQTDDLTQQEELLTRAIRHYAEVDRYDSDNEDAAANKALAQRLLDDIKPPEEEEAPPPEDQPPPEQPEPEESDEQGDSSESEESSGEQGEQGQEGSEGSPGEEGEPSEAEEGGEDSSEMDPSESRESETEGEPGDDGSPQDQPSRDGQPQEGDQGEEHEQQPTPAPDRQRPEDHPESAEGFQMSPGDEQEVMHEGEGTGEAMAGVEPNGMTPEAAMRLLNTIRQVEKKLPLVLEDGTTDKGIPMEGGGFRDW